MKKLLLLFAITMSALGMKAQSWTAPTLTQAEDFTSTEGVYVYHVGQGQFLTKTTWWWGTHSGLSTDASSAWLYVISQLTDEDNVTYYRLYCASASNTGYLFVADWPHLYTDYSSSTTLSQSYFDIKKNTNGYYNITIAANSLFANEETYGVDYSTWQLGWNPDANDVNSSGTSLGTNLALYMLDPSESDDYQTDFAFVTASDYALYSAQVSLYDALNEASELGYTESELATYAALLTGTDTDAIAEATSEVNTLILNYAYDHASADNPYDITSVISNPTFEGTQGAEPDGDWIDTYGNMLIQNNKSYLLWVYEDEDDEEGAVSSTEYGLNNFAQNWTSSTTESIDASDIHQTISDLPQGTYIMTADCIATSASTDLIVSGCKLYATSGAITYSVDIDKNPYGATGAGYPHRYTVNITHFGGDLTIGYGFTPGYVKWFAVDNFTLAYAGPVDNAGLVALQAVIPVLEAYYEGYDDGTYVYKADTYEAIVALLAEAEEVANSNDSDACEEMAVTITDMVSTVQEEITAYKSLASLLEQMESDMTNYEAFDDLYNTLAGLYDTYEEAYDDGTATVDEITEWVDGYEAIVLAGVLEAMADATTDNPIEITSLCTNMGYDSNSWDGWTVSVTSSSGTKSVSYYEAEVWNSAFTCLQTISNMPVGSYKLTANAFYRVGANATAYSYYLSGDEDILTKLTVAGATAPVKSICEGASTEYTNTSYWACVDSDAGIYTPNTMYAASVLFAASDVYQSEVTGYLTTDGDLTFGIRNDGDVLTDAWSIWDSFRLYYCGKSNEALYEAMLALQDEVAELMDAASMIQEASDRLYDAYLACDDLTMMSSEDELTEAINNLTEAIAYANDGLALAQELLDTYNSYDEMYTEADYSDDDFETLLEEISDALASEEFDSNEQIQAWIDALPTAWIAAVLANVEGISEASLENPVDVTAVITNPSFDTGTNDTTGATGWNFEFATSSGHIGWNTTTQQSYSDYAYEYWYVTSFEMSQTISGLAAGYYHLSCNALYRPGNNDATAAAAWLADNTAYDDMYLYANTVTTPIACTYSGYLTEDPGATGEASITVDGATWYLPNTMQGAYEWFTMGYYLNELDFYLEEGADLTIGINMVTAYAYNWFVMDNFKLLYYGDGDENMPEAVEAIEVAPASQAIYDLTGRKVSKTAKGIYIINGNKILK